MSVPFGMTVGGKEPSQKISGERFCSLEGCGTRLSVYNLNDRCSLHRRSAIASEYLNGKAHKSATRGLAKKRKK